MPQRFLDLLESHGYNFFAGVPCSFFEGVTRILDREPRYGYVSGVREDSAAPPNHYHIVSDSGAHGSTGDQRTIADRVPLEDALVAGYRHAQRLADIDAIDDAVRELFSAPGPAMLLIEVERGNQTGIGRVEREPQLSARFREAAR